MSRRRTSLLEDIFDMTTKSPWWLGVSIAAALWIAGLIVQASAASNSPTAAFHTLGRYFLNLLAGMVLVGAIISGIKQLLNRTRQSRCRAGAGHSIEQPEEMDCQEDLPVNTGIEVSCPNCQQLLIAPTDMAGLEATCEHCRTVLRVPALPRKSPSSLPLAAIVLPPHPDIRPTHPARSTPPEHPEITLDLLNRLEWKRFEQVVASYFECQGLKAAVSRVGADGGVDITLCRPPQPKIESLVQCKAWHLYDVGVKPIRELYGVMAAESVPHGVFVTTGHYTSEARSFAHGKNLLLMDGPDLLQAIRKLPPEARRRLHQVATTGDYTTPTCPRCGQKMVRRVGAKGKGSGVPFWGCRGYPRCRAILKLREQDETKATPSTNFY
jgi:predicted RNA-binding Zn-ribbon protein involved in translation (DUF1610 family)